ALVARVRALAPSPPGLGEEVTRIIAAVREQGDSALRELARRFGEPVADDFRVDRALVARAPDLLEPDLLAGLQVAAANIEAVARAELEAVGGTATADLPQGHTVEVRAAPVGAAGVYAPG